MSAKQSQREWWGAELGRVYDSIEQKEAELREEVKERRGVIGKLEKRARELRDLLSNRRGIQLPIPEGEAAQAARILEEVHRHDEG